MAGRVLGKVGAIILVALTITSAVAPSEAIAACRVTGNGNNIFCDSCADAQTAPLADRTVDLSGNINPNGQFTGSQNSFCEIANLAPNETLDMIFTDMNSGGAYVVDFDGQKPNQTITPSTASANVAPNSTVTQSFASGAQGPADTRANANIRKTQPTAQNFSVAAKLTCSCTSTGPQEANLTVNKAAVGGPGGTFSFASNNANFTNANLNVATDTTEQIGTATLTAPFGAITVTETPDANYPTRSASCVVTGTNTAFPSSFVNDVLTVTPQAGDNVTCTITNIAAQVPDPEVILRKVTTDGGTETFGFASTVAAFNNITLTTNGGSDQTAAQTVTANQQISITEETIGAGYELSDASCSGGAIANQSFDLNARELTVTPQAGTITCTFTNRPVVRQTGSLTIRKVVNGADKNFSFSGTTPFGNFTLSNGQTTTRSNLPPGNFIITETLDPAYSLNSIRCRGNSNAPVIDLNAGTLTIFVAAGDDVTCTFRNGQVRDPRMEEETKRFIHRRVDNLLTHAPSRARLVRRLQERDPPQESLKDTEPLKLQARRSGPRSFANSRIAAFGSVGAGIRSADAHNLGGPPRSSLEAYLDNSGEHRSQTASPFVGKIMDQVSQAASNSGSYKFSASLSEIRAMAAQSAAETEKKKLMASGLDFRGQAVTTPHVAPRPGLDLWIEGQISRYDDNTGGVDREGDFRILYVGTDYVIAPGVLIGALIQIDDTKEDIRQVGEHGRIEGTGWMAGPYFGARLFKDLYLDVRAAWGQSDNDIELTDGTNGFRSGSFETDRWLASATLTGNKYYGAWRISPQVGLAYGHESFDTYTNSLGLVIPGDDASIGRLTGTLEVGYRMMTNGGYRIEPHAALTGIWNFDSEDLVINGVLAETDDNRARIEGGVLVTMPQGWSFRAAGNYDGIGGGEFESYGGSLWISVPLN